MPQECRAAYLLLRKHPGSAPSAAKVYATQPASLPHASQQSETVFTVGSEMTYDLLLMSSWCLHVLVACRLGGTHSEQAVPLMLTAIDSPCCSVKKSCAEPHRTGNFCVTKSSSAGSRGWSVSSVAPN